MKLPKFNDGNNSQNQQIIYTQPTPQDLVSYIPRSRITFTDDGKFVYQNGEEVSVPLDEIVVQTKGGRPLTKVQEEIAKHNEEIDKSKVFGKVVLVISNFGVIYAFLLNNYLYIFIGIIMLSLLVFLIHIWRKNEGRRNN